MMKNWKVTINFVYKRTFNDESWYWGPEACKSFRNAFDDTVSNDLNEFSDEYRYKLIPVSKVITDDCGRYEGLVIDYITTRTAQEAIEEVKNSFVESLHNFKLKAPCMNIYAEEVV